MLNHWKEVERELSRWQRPETGVQEAIPAYGEWGGQSAWAVLREAMEAGLPWAIAEAVKGCLGWSDAVLARFLRVSEKTLQRSRSTGKELGVDAAEKVLDLVAVLGRGVEAFGDPRRFFAWLRTPSLWFGEELPESALFDAFGRRRLEEAIGRIDYGLFS
jgi:putative toxin-antitoxin system antitoxin component (TIGR02293 family)